MQQEQLVKTNFVTEEEWELTPSRVKDLVVPQKLTIEELQKEQRRIKEDTRKLARKS